MVTSTDNTHNINIEYNFSIYSLYKESFIIISSSNPQKFIFNFLLKLNLSNSLIIDNINKKYLIIFNQN